MKANRPFVMVSLRMRSGTRNDTLGRDVKGSKYLPYISPPEYNAACLSAPEMTRRHKEIVTQPPKEGIEVYV